jgi:hypothetical protein
VARRDTAFAHSAGVSVDSAVSVVGEQGTAASKATATVGDVMDADRARANT